MRKIVVIIFVTLFLNANSQTWVTIPDVNFVSYLQTIIPAAMNGNQMNINSTLVTTTTQTINVSGKTISNLSGIEHFTSLTYLDCSNNNIFGPPFNLPNSVSYLNCSHNNFMYGLPLSSSLIYLDCSYDNLTSLPNLPNSLTFLNCYNNSISTLPTLPNSLNRLNCGQNSLISLPALPASLAYLNCSPNFSLTSLPTLPSSLTVLFCSYCNLNSLPNLPNSMDTLSFNWNHVTSILSLPSSLKMLGCGNNSLTSLPSLPNTISYLECMNNNILCFPVFPNTITTCLMFGNPYNCLPNYVLPAMNSYTTSPLCTTGNSNGCPLATAGVRNLGIVDEQINIYPNPTIGNFAIETVKEMSIVITNVLGETVLTQKMHLDKNDINISDYANGIYFINVGNETIKLIKE